MLLMLLIPAASCVLTSSPADSLNSQIAVQDRARIGISHHRSKVENPPPVVDSVNT